VSLFIPAHVVVRLQASGDTVTVAGFDYDWFMREMEQGRPTALRPAADAWKNVVLTAGTSAVRAWLAAQPPQGPVFDEGVRFVRQTP